MYTVRCQSASGRTLDVHVRGCSTQEQACRKALSTLDPADGWQAVYAL
jgi:hypothetical protein